MDPLVGAARRYDGPMGKSDRAFAFGLRSAGVVGGLLPGVWIDGLFVPIARLLLWTLLNRVRQGLAEAEWNLPLA